MSDGLASPGQGPPGLIMGQLPDADGPHEIARRLRAGLAPGSYLALCDGTDTSAALNEAIRIYNENSASSYHLRRPGRIAAFFDGLEMVPPGVTGTAQWRPDRSEIGSSPEELDAICGVGRQHDLG